MTRSYVTALILQRTREKRNREAERSNHDATQAWVPFTDWLRCKLGVSDWHTLRKHDLWEKFNEYQVDCLSNRMDYECPQLYGLRNTLY